MEQRLYEMLVQIATYKYRNSSLMGLVWSRGVSIRRFQPLRSGTWWLGESDEQYHSPYSEIANNPDILRRWFQFSQIRSHVKKEALCGIFQPKFAAFRSSTAAGRGKTAISINFPSETSEPQWAKIKHTGNSLRSPCGQPLGYYSWRVTANCPFIETKV